MTGWKPIPRGVPGSEACRRPGREGLSRECPPESFAALLTLPPRRRRARHPMPCQRFETFSKPSGSRGSALAARLLRGPSRTAILIEFRMLSSLTFGECVLMYTYHFGICLTDRPPEGVMPPAEVPPFGQASAEPMGTSPSSRYAGVRQLLRAANPTRRGPPLSGNPGSAFHMVSARSPGLPLFGRSGRIEAGTGSGVAVRNLRIPRLPPCGTTRLTMDRSVTR